ncbi:penicillin-binding transpeptidase domain-containing protein [Jeotgalibacillus soli]|uniref:Peptidoglycan glycosyltransferase n=1 Tax=Jeotgalibacillus soli TaxID=889306 RepID=A0A0C2S9K3_9BACL|nr:penicillin-binding transpeptidase domain-containing protein [Jeotgalibacillus soli]KIL50639.1 hypothetical protein KP78_06400 [Jeotgalibacillus soli]
MKKWLTGIFIIAAALTVTGCQEKVMPDDRLADYIALWNEKDFSVMYEDFVSSETKEIFGVEDYVDRVEKLYTDLEIQNVEVTFDSPEGDETEWSQEEPAMFPIHVKMETLAGPVEFDKEVSLVYEERGEQENWFVDWAPSFIFPDLAKEDAIRVTTTPSVRGEVLDRNEKGLAINGTGFEVGAIPGELTNEAKAALAEQLTLTVEYIDSQLNQAWVQPDLFVPLKQLASSQNELVNRVTELPGVQFQQAEMREYPYGEALSHLTGYIGPINAEELEEHEGHGYTASDYIGKRGLEQLLEERLRGSSGARIFIEKAGEGAETITVAETAPVNGETITLTIDADLQQMAYNAMKGQPGTSAAVDPKTGETLVLTSSPGFDPNEWTLGISAERREELSNNPNAPTLNRFAAAYAPGSTQKTLTAAIGLKAGTLDPNEGYTINGLTWQKDDSWGDFQVTRVHEAANPINLNKGLVFSDNIYFAQTALEMGSVTLINGLKETGYEEEMPYSYPLTMSQISNDGSISSEGQLVDTSYGQGEMLTNILHLATMYEIVLNDGTMIKPTLFADEATGEVWKEGLLSAEHAAILRNDLREVVTVGFAHPANIESIAIAGKTGTAELKGAGEDQGKENGFFVAYNQDNPAFIMAMMIEGVEDIGGSTYVSELVTEVFVNNQEREQP